MSGRGRPKLDLKLPVVIATLMEAYRAPARSGNKPASVRAASEWLARDLKKYGAAKPAETLRRLYKRATEALKDDARGRDFAVWMAAELGFWKARLDGKFTIAEIFVTLDTVRAAHEHAHREWSKWETQERKKRLADLEAAHALLSSRSAGHG